MAIIKQQTPYEFLVRWTNGTVAGAHIRFLERLVEDGVVTSEKEGDAQPVSMAGGAGFPIADILSAIQSTALTDLATAQAAKAASDMALKTVQDAFTAEQGKSADLQAQIDAYTPPASSTSVTMRQARLALLSAGLLDQVTAAIAALPEPDKSAALIEWEYAATVERDSGLIPTMGTALGLSTAQLDALFATAAML